GELPELGRYLVRTPVGVLEAVARLGVVGALVLGVGNAVAVVVVDAHSRATTRRLAIDVGAVVLVVADPVPVTVAGTHLGLGLLLLAAPQGDRDPEEDLGAGCEALADAAAVAHHVAYVESEHDPAVEIRLHTTAEVDRNVLLA